MLLHHARSSARLDDAGDRVTCSLTRIVPGGHRGQITEVDARSITRCSRSRPLGGTRPLPGQAAIVALHDQAPTAQDTDWPQIKALYTELAAAGPNLLSNLNAAVATAWPDGPAEAGPARPTRRQQANLQSFTYTRRPAPTCSPLGRRSDAATATARPRTGPTPPPSDVSLTRKLACQPETTTQSDPHRIPYTNLYGEAAGQNRCPDG